MQHCQELKRLHQALAKARRSGALLARRRLARLEALAAWVAQQRDDGSLIALAGCLESTPQAPGCQSEMKVYWVVATQIVFIFTPNFGEDFHIFQMGWVNHQLV